MKWRVNGTGNTPSETGAGTRGGDSKQTHNTAVCARTQYGVTNHLEHDIVHSVTEVHAIWCVALLARRHLHNAPK